MKELVAAVALMALLVTPASASDSEQFSFTVTTERNGVVREVGTFGYARTLVTPTLDAPAGWTDGDRIAYRCGFAFLVYRGQLVGRVTFTRIDPADADPYAKINDRYLHERSLDWDGSSYTGPDDRSSFCPDPEEAYLPLEGDPGPPPVVTFQHGPHTIDVRDFSDPADASEVGPGHQFKIVKVTPDRVAVVAYEDGIPAVAVYYDRLSSEVVPGTMHPVTLLTSSGLDPLSAGPKAKTTHVQMKSGERLRVACDGSARVRKPSPGRVVIRCLTPSVESHDEHSPRPAARTRTSMEAGERLRVDCDGKAAVRRPSATRVVIRCR
jgi:hypothetical protein